jgi:hypothetical protein
MKFLFWKVKLNEDVFFSRFVKNVAPREVNAKFACETEFRLGTLGAHAIDEWLTKAECEQIRRQYDGERKV